MTGHFDIAEAERVIRAKNEAVIAAALANAPDDETRRFIQLQGDLSALQREAVLWTMRSVNRHADFEMMANALGRSVGNIIRDFCRHTSDPGATLELVFEVIADSLAAAADRDHGIARDDIMTDEVEIVAQPGGRA